MDTAATATATSETSGTEDGTAAAVDAPATAPPGPAAAAPRRGLAHEPALDGLRGVALMGIIAFHLHRFPGGFLTVDLFFALSGFLITSLLLTEARATGGVGLGAFWARRARRLLPALWVTLVGVGVLLLIYTPEAERAGFRDDALSTLGYIFNWQRLTETSSYWDLFSQPSPLEHMWTLAIEEQFYVVWPLTAVLLLRLGRGPSGGVSTVRWVALGGATIAAVWMALAYSRTDTNFAYFSTVTRLAPMLLAAAMATLTVGRPRRTKPPAREWDVLAVAALFVMVVLLLSAEGQAPMYYQGGMVVFSLASCIVIWSVTGGPLGLVGRLFALRPLQWFGRISYGVYLWHWPVIVFMTIPRVGLDRWAVDSLRMGTTVLVAMASYRWLEQPIRRGALPGRRAWIAAGAGLTVTLAVVLVATDGETRTVTLEEATKLIDEPLDEGVDSPILYIPAEDDVPDGAVKVLLVGDSGPAAWGPELVDEAERMARSRARAAEGDDEADGPPISVAWASQYLCSPVNADGPTLTPEGDVIQEEPCHGVRRDMWRSLVRQYEPDIVVYYLANAGFTHPHLVDGQWVPECNPVFDTYLTDTIDLDARLLSAGGASFVLATSPYTATLLEGTRETVDCRNATYVRVAQGRPGTRVIDLNAFVLTQPNEDMFADSVHFSENGGELAARWLLPQVLEWCPDGPGSAPASASTPGEAGDAAAQPGCGTGGGQQGSGGGGDGDE